MNTEPSVILPTDRRQSVRIGFTLPALIQIGEGLPLRPCTVLDVSTGGGRVRIDARAPIPDTFVLLFTRSGSVRRDCKVVWRQDRYLGVVFSGRFDHVPE